ncbi:MAG: GIN domain-containing protein [Bacteroidales bacterium]
MTRNALITLLLFLAYTDGYAQDSEIIEKSLNLKSFSAIDIGFCFDVEVSLGSPQTVEVTYESELSDKVEFYVSNGTFVAKIKNDNWLKQGFFGSKSEKVDTKPTIKITMSELKSIDASGASSIKVLDKIDRDKLSIDASGASSVVLSLAVNNLSLDASGSSLVKLEGLAESTSLDVSGSSRVTMNIDSKTVAADVSGGSLLGLTGKCNIISIDCSGGSSINADNYKCKDLSISASGAARTSISASNDVSAEASGASSVRISGSPSGKISKSSSGASSISIN